MRRILGVPDGSLEERFVRSSGPGGQNVNKVATAVELRLDLSRSGLPEDVRVRLRALSRSRMTSDDVLVIDAREYRTQTKNREAARERLADLIEQASRRPRPRRRTRPTGASRERRIDDKKKRAIVKSRRGASRDEE